MRKRGYDEGWEEAREKFVVEYPCNVCGEPLTVTNADCKQRIWTILSKLSEETHYPLKWGSADEDNPLSWTWGHKECHEQT